MDHLFYCLYFPENKFLIAVIRNDIPALEGLALSEDIVRAVEARTRTFNQLLEKGAGQNIQKLINSCSHIRQLAMKAHLIVPVTKLNGFNFNCQPGEQFVEIYDEVSGNLLLYFHRGEMADFIINDEKRSLVRAIYLDPMDERFRDEDCVTLINTFPSYLDENIEF